MATKKKKSSKENKGKAFWNKLTSVTLGSEEKYIKDNIFDALLFFDKYAAHHRFAKNFASVFEMKLAEVEVTDAFISDILLSTMIENNPKFEIRDQRQLNFDMVWYKIPDEFEIDEDTVHSIVELSENELHESNSAKAERYCIDEIVIDARDDNNRLLGVVLQQEELSEEGYQLTYIEED